MVELLSSSSSSTPSLSSRPAVAPASGQARDDSDIDEDLPDNISDDPNWMPGRTARNLQRNAPRDRLCPPNARSPAHGQDSINQTFLPVPNHLLVSYNAKDEGVSALRGWADQTGFKLWLGGGSYNSIYLKCSRLRSACSYHIRLNSDAHGKWQVVTVCDRHNHRITIDNSSTPGPGQRGSSIAQSDTSLASHLHRSTASLEVPQARQQEERQQHNRQQQQLGQHRQQQQEQTSPQQQQRAHSQHQGTSPVRIQQQPSAQDQQQQSRSKRLRSDSDHVQPAEVVDYASRAISTAGMQASTSRSRIAADDQLQPDQQAGQLATSRSFPGIDIDRLEETASGLGLRELIDLSAQIKYVDKLIERRLRGL